MGQTIPTAFIRIPLMAHIKNRLKKLEQATGAVACLQYADHPEGLSMNIRLFVMASEKEFTYPDVILPSEYSNAAIEIERVDVLFDCIHKALESVQPVTSTSGGLIHH